MAPGKKSVFRQSGAQHFQLVHRSLRDPLSLDSEANQRVLKELERPNARKSANTLADLHATERRRARDNEGEAAGYGIAYDDSDYDYMQHLRTVGEGGGVIESFIIPQSRGSNMPQGLKSYNKGKGKATAEGLLFGPMDASRSGESSSSGLRNTNGGVDLPASVLPSDREMSLQEVYDRQQDIPSALAGFQPGMDPHLRQVLEALSDEEFEDNDDEGDWFGDLVKGGERADPDEVEFEFEEWGVDDRGVPLAGPSAPGGSGQRAVAGDEDGSDEEVASDEEDGGVSWDHVKAFKREQKQKGGKGEAVSDFGGNDEDEYDDAERSEMADTVGSLIRPIEDLMVKGGKVRNGKRGPSDATGMSMSSSTMFRSGGLRDLDDRFDQIERQYEMDDDEDEEFSDDDGTASIAPSMMSNMSSMSKMSLFSTSSAAPPLVSREDFDAILDDFLDNHEVVGKKYKQSLGATNLSGPEKLAVLRAAVDGDDGEGIGHAENRRRILELERMERSLGLPGRHKGSRLEKMERVKREEDEGDKWDVETILTTYTNTDNHPGMIRACSAAEQKKRAEARAAAAAAAAATASVPPPPAASAREVEDEDDSGSETEREGPKVTVTRPKGESAEERKARKAGVKAQRQARRVEKKSHQETFDKERKRQIKTQTRLVSGGRAADLNVVSRQVVSLS